MELWIRSQNKQLIRKANYEMCYNERNGHNYIVVDGDVLGSYKTKERALEVLREIDERIMLLNTLSIAKDRDTLLALKNALPEEKLQGLAYPYEIPEE